MAEAFATSSDLDTFTGRSVPSGQATLMLAAASALIRKTCGWHIWPSQKETLTVDGPGTVTLSLPTMLLTAVESVTEAGTALVDGTDYQWSAAGQMRRLGGVWTSDMRGVVAAITHGYVDVPDELKAVCCSVAARAVANPMGAKSEQAGGESVTYAVPGGLIDYELMALEPYKLGGRL